MNGLTLRLEKRLHQTDSKTWRRGHHHFYDCAHFRVVGLGQSTFFQVTNDIPLLYSFFGGTAILALIGIWDDLYNLRAIVKLGAQICAALVVFLAGIQIEVVTLPLYGPIYLGVMSLPITVFWFVLVINAVNLIDGMDGLAGSVVVLSGATLFIMGVIEKTMSRAFFWLL